MKRELVFFFALAYTISWVIWLPLILGQSGLRVLDFNLPIFYVSAGTIGPTLAALITQRRFHGDWRAFRLWTSWRRMLAGMAVGSLLIFACVLLAALAMTKEGFDRWQWSAALSFVYMFLPNLAGGPLGEEPGWRGFALPRLQATFRPWTSSVILGVLWATWHLPLFLVPEWSSMTYPLYVLFLTSASILIGCGFNVSQGSAIVAVILHGVLNMGIGVGLNQLLGEAVVREWPNPVTIIALSFAVAATVVAVVQAALDNVRYARSRSAGSSAQSV